MISANQIRQAVLAYLLESDSSDRFALEFAKLSHGIVCNGDHEAVALANEIELKIAAFHDKLISVADFKYFLRELIVANRVVSTVSAPVAQQVSSPYFAAEESSAYPLVACTQSA